MQANDVVFEGPIVAVNRGGAIVLVEVSTIYQNKCAMDATRYALRPCTLNGMSSRSLLVTFR